MIDDQNKLYPCSRCEKVSESTDTTWRIRYDIWSSDPKALGNQRVLCTNCSIAFQEDFMKEVNDENRKRLGNFFSKL